MSDEEFEDFLKRIDSEVMTDEIASLYNDVDISNKSLRRNLT